MANPSNPVSEKAILLVNAPTQFAKMAKGFVPPLGLGYIASFLQQKGFPVRLIDLELIEPFDLGICQILKCIEKHSVGLVGISFSTHNRFSGFQLAEKIRERFSKERVAIILGGHHAANAVRDTLSLPFVDFVCTGEGEKCLFKLAQVLFQGKGDQSTVPNLAYKEPSGEIVETPQDAIENLDELPWPARELFEMPHYTFSFPSTPRFPCPRNATQIITSRGCPFRCRFCSTAKTHGMRKPRYRSIADVVREIAFLRDTYDIDGYVIYDDNFLMNPARVQEFCETLKAQGITLPFLCYGRVTGLNQRLLRQLADVGLKVISFGIESGSQKVLDFLHKNISVSDIYSAVKMCQQCGILAKGTLIFGSPAETPKTFRETLAMIQRVKEIQPDAGIGVGPASGVFIYPGTPFFDWAKEIGQLPSDFSWAKEFSNLEYAPNSPLYSIPLLRNKAMIRRIDFFEENRTFFSRIKKFLKEILRNLGYIKRIF